MVNTIGLRPYGQTPAPTLERKVSFGAKQGPDALTPLDGSDELKNAEKKTKKHTVRNALLFLAGIGAAALAIVTLKKSPG